MVVKGRLARFRGRFEAWHEAAATLPPTPAEIATATLIGGCVLALANAIAIAATVDLPADGVGLRLRHHLFDALEALAAAAALALPAGLAARYGRGPRWLGWLALYAACAAGMGTAMFLQLRRQADVLLDGAAPRLILVIYVLLCGLVVPASFVVGGFFARLGRWAVVSMAAAIGGFVTNYLILRDDYPGVHAAILWTSMSLFGASLAPSALRWLSRGRRRQIVIAIAAVIGVVGIAWTPPNAVRIQLFRQPGAVAPWVLARLRWRPPAVPEAPAPELAPIGAETMKRAVIGVPDNPVVVLFTMEALRADVLADPANDTRLPMLAKLRDRGAYFTKFSAPGSQTSVSLTSMFASRYFSQLYWHRYGQGRTRFLYAAEDDSPRFPGLLTAAGIHTSSHLGLIFLSGDRGIARGFAKENMLVEGRIHGAAHVLMRSLFDALRSVGDRPAFLFVHLMEPHEPYNRGKLKKGKPFERYLSEIEVVDYWLTKLVSYLKRHHRGRGYVIVSGDHGEAFGEHGTRYHSKTLYEEMVAVPLIVWGPGILKRRIDERASLIDIGPTVLHLFRQPIPDGYMGRSLLPVMRGLDKTLTRPVVMEGRLRRAMYSRSGLKVIEDTVLNVVEVYDLERDPGELRNLFGTDSRAAGAVAEMRAFFAEHTNRRPGYTVPYKR